MRKIKTKLMQLPSASCLLALTALCSCSRGSLDNFKIPDQEREAIKRNRIDTTYIFYGGQEDGSEIKTYQTYNENGQVVFDNTSTIDEVRYFYNEHGLLIKKEWNWLRSSMIMIDTLIYDFDDDNRIRSVKCLDRTDRDGFKYNDRGREEKFTYDDDGHLIEKIETRSYASGPSRAKTTYKYDGDLLTRCSFFRSNSATPWAETFFYYSSQKLLDSTVMKLAVGDQSPFRAIYKDGLIFQESHGSYVSGKRFVHTIRKQ